VNADGVARDTSRYDGRPWLAHYPDNIPAELQLPACTPIGLFTSTAKAKSADAFLLYFDRTITFGEVDGASSALAAALAGSGVGRGDRVAAFLQNDPEFVVAQLATWKIGAVFVSINPMLREQELEYILNDSGTRALVVLEDLYRDVAEKVVERTRVRYIVTTRPERGGEPEAAAGTLNGAGESRAVTPLDEIISDWDGAVRPLVDVAAEEVALIGYTSGTSGHPKGVRTTHANLAYNAEVYRRWMAIDDHDVFICGTPIFHITGLVAGLALSYLAGTPMVLFHRFDPATFLELTQRWNGTFTVMAITAYQAVMNHPAFKTADLSKLAKVYSGGAPVSPATEQAWRSATGHGIHNIYGLTETTSPSHAVPLGVQSPVDEEFGALSVGIPVPGAEVRIVDPESLVDLAIGQPGEVWIRGPMVSDGYWNMPDASAAAFVDGYLRTGDIGKMDADGWFFIIDRLKDMINASGYKVWPREVEDFLYQHPAVREAAVVGVPDSYRGENVMAVISLKAGHVIAPADIIEFCKARMAAYKYPRIVEIRDELPKTASGKILRRELRAEVASAAPQAKAPTP
jgi:long-chain acyl-CoA synthetase